MKHKYRGELINGKIVNIFDFNGRIAECDNGFGNIDIDQFNTIYYPATSFKSEILKIEELNSDNTDETIVTKTRKKDS